MDEENELTEYSKAPEGTPWDFRGTDYDIAQLKRASAYVESPGETKDQCHLPHHKPDGTLIWRGVTAAMGALRGARDGYKGPGKQAAHKHLAKHYGEFGKEVPTQEWLFQESAGNYIIDSCGQCKFFEELLDTVVKEPKVIASETSDGYVITKDGGIGPGRGECQVAQILVKKLDAACGDGRPRDAPTATKNERTIESVEALILKSELNDAKADLLQERAEKHREIEAHLKTQKKLVEASDRLKRKTNEATILQGDNDRLKKDKIELREKLDVRDRDITRLQIQITGFEKDLELQNSSQKGSRKFNHGTFRTNKGNQWIYRFKSRHSRKRIKTRERSRGTAEETGENHRRETRNRKQTEEGQTHSAAPSWPCSPAWTSAAAAAKPPSHRWAPTTPYRS